MQDSRYTSQDTGDDFTVPALSTSPRVVHELFPRTSRGRMPSDVAVLNVGLARTMAHPLVVASFQNFCMTLRTQHALEVLLWISTAAGSNQHKFRDQMILAYRAHRLWIDTHQPLRCNQNCTRAVPCSSAKDSTFSWLAQFEKVRLAWLALQQHERERGATFSWVVKTRPDLVYFEPLPSLHEFMHSEVYVPHGGVRLVLVHHPRANTSPPVCPFWPPHRLSAPSGPAVMSRLPQFQDLNDHVFVCPRALCEPYFDVTADYLRCSSNRFFKASGPPQLLLRRHFNLQSSRLRAAASSGRGSQPAANASGQVRLFRLAYTLFKGSRLECSRLECGLSSYATGCEAPHLTAFVPACKRAAASLGRQGS